MDKEALALKTPLKFWFKHEDNKQDYKKAVLPVATFNTVQNFWAFYQHFKRPSSFADRWELFLFKSNILPEWEQPANKNGGAFALKFLKEKADKIYEDLVLAFIAKNIGEWGLVNGIRFKVRKEILHIEVWIPNCENSEKVDQARDWIIESICLNHDTSIELIKFNIE